MQKVSPRSYSTSLFSGLELHEKKLQALILIYFIFENQALGVPREATVTEFFCVTPDSCFLH